MNEQKKRRGRPAKVDAPELEAVAAEAAESEPEPEVAAEEAPPPEPAKVRNLTREMVALRLGEDKAQQMIQ